MKVKVNQLTGMVAVVALAPMSTHKKGDVFGVLPEVAADLLKQKAVEPVKDLPSGDEAPKYVEIDINIDTGAISSGAPAVAAVTTQSAKPAQQAAQK